MSISYGLNLGIMNGAADGDLYGDSMRAFQRACDAFLQPVVKGYLTNTPPGSPVDGDMYIVGYAPTGSWASYAGYVAKWSALLAAWEFYLPKNGWQFQSNSAREIYRRTGGAWEIYYQEGTWTPTIKGTTTPGSHTYATQFGIYTRIGRLVSLQFNTTMSAKDAAMAGNVQMGGLPFAMSQSNPTPTIITCDNFTISPTYLYVCVQSNGSTAASIVKNNSTGWGALVDAADINANSGIYGSIVYPIN